MNLDWFSILLAVGAFLFEGVMVVIILIIWFNKAKVDAKEHATRLENKMDKVVEVLQDGMKAAHLEREKQLEESRTTNSHLAKQNGSLSHIEKKQEDIANTVGRTHTRLVSLKERVDILAETKRPN